MVAALSAVRERADSPTLLILCGDMSQDFFVRGLKRLNSKAALEAYVEDYTPAPFFDACEAEWGVDNPAPYIALWRDLVLGNKTTVADRARLSGATSFDVEERLEEIGAAIVPLLIELVKEHAFAPAFHVKGSEAWVREGALTPQCKLATSATFLIKAVGDVSDPDIERLQEILRMRVAADASLELASTLAENIARVLHSLRPRRFPSSELDPKTNHLRNPDPFLRTDRASPSA